MSGSTGTQGRDHRRCRRGHALGLHAEPLGDVPVDVGVEACRLGPRCGAHTFPYIELANSSSILEHVPEDLRRKLNGEGPQLLGLGRREARAPTGANMRPTLGRSSISYTGDPFLAQVAGTLARG